MSNNNHPVSPHLQIYRLPLTALLSITHRLTGVILAFGCVLLVWLLAAAAQSAEAYEALVPHYQAWYGQIIVLGFLFSLYLHFCNGIRHLFWDVGYGFELETVDLTAKIAIGMAAVLTVTTWVVAWMIGGAG
jgi:succinate dehydrogenase / fumarate reductase cytochrome b subunit